MGVNGICLTPSGVQKQRVEKCAIVSGFDIYATPTDLSKRMANTITFYIQDKKYMVPVGSFHSVEEVKAFMQGKTIYDINVMMTKSINQSLANGRYAHRGYAIYLGIENEVNVHNQKVTEIFRIENEKRMFERKQEEKQQAENIRLNLEASDKKFRSGEIIDGASFLYLCEKYGIVIPARTKGWIEANLNQICTTKTGIKYRLNNGRKYAPEGVIKVVYSLIDTLKVN